MPRISVILTCYNHLRWLPAAFESVLAQTFEEYELLAIDDGSTDGTRDWLREHESDKCRCIFNDGNLGTYASLNRGIEESKGEFIAILNDDDLWAPAKLAAQLGMMERNPSMALTHTGGWFIDDDGNRHPDAAPMGFPFPSTPSGDLLGTLIHHNQMITSSVLVRREAFEACGQFDPSFYGYGDWQMWLRIAEKFEIGFVDEALTFYRVHGSNAAWNDEKMAAEGVKIREWIAQWDALRDHKDLEPALAHNWACLGTEYNRAGRREDARKAYGKSIKLMPTRLKSYLRWLSVSK
jgi:glycosyltransferase involved in cell wall biosynthesis